MPEPTKKIIEGLWDCPYCGHKGIGGLTKVCPGCGHPQDKGTKFYLPTDKNYHYLDKEKSEQYGKGADWICPYCGGYNRYDAKVCKNCAAPREEAEGDYFSNSNQEQIDKRENPAKPKPAPQPVKEKKKSGPPILLILLAMIIAAGVFWFMPKNYDAKIADKIWNRVISIDEYKTVSESGWSVPDGGRTTDKKQEVHHYDQVLDHYKDVEVQRSRRVQDGYDTETYTRNNGDGTFTEETRSVPRYVTEYYTETVQEPVYRSVPVYATKYYYDIERWIPTRTVDSSGKDDDPYWGETNLTSKERENGRDEDYLIVLEKKDKTYRYYTSQDEWEKYKIGDGVKITVSGNTVQSIQ